MATCGCSKEVFRQSYELLYQDLSARYKDQGWSDCEIRREAARQFRPRYQLDVASYIRESTEKGAYYTAEFTIDLHGRIFFPSYNISLEALHDNQRRKTPDQYSLSDHQTSRMIEEAFRRGATTVVTSYARDGNDNRDIVVMIYDPKTKMGKQLIINAAPDGAFHSFEGIQAIAERQFSHLNKVSPSDRVFILTDRTISLPQAQSVIQQVVQENKANQRSYASSNESFADGHKLRRDANSDSNEQKKARQDPKESFSASQVEEKNEQEKKHIPLPMNEMQSETNQTSYNSLIVADDQELQSRIDQVEDNQRRSEANELHTIRRPVKFSYEGKAISLTAIEKRDRRVIEVPIGIGDEKEEDVSLDSLQQYSFQVELFDQTNKQIDADPTEKVLEKQEAGDFLEILGADPFIRAIQNEMFPMDHGVINAKRREKVGEEDSGRLDEAISAFQERERALKEHFALSQEPSFADDLATDKHDVDTIDDRDPLIEGFFVWIHEQPSMVSKLLYEYQAFESDENQQADKRMNISVAMFFLVALQRIANRSVDSSPFDSVSYNLDFSIEGFNEKNQVKAVDLAKHLDIRNENPQMSFLNRQEENFILWRNVNSEEELVLRIFSFYALRMFLNANRAFPYGEQTEEYRYSFWILLSIIRYMAMMKENAMSSYSRLRAYSPKKTYNFPQSGVIFMLSLHYDRYPANQQITV